MPSVTPIYPSVSRQPTEVGNSNSAATAAELLEKIKTVDGPDSGLDSDLLDGQHGSHYLNRTNHTGAQAISTVTGLQAELDARQPRWATDVKADHGADATGATDSLAAFTAAFAAANNRNAVVIPEGIYDVNSAVARPNDITIIKMPGADFVDIAAAAAVFDPSSIDVSLVHKSIYAMDSVESRPGVTAQTFHSYRVKNTGATANYQKSAAFFMTATSDPSEGTENGGAGASINKDVTGVDMRGIILAGNMTGRAWGGLSWAEVRSGADGYLCGHEIDVVNGGSANSLPGTPLAKYGLQIASYVGAATAGLIFSKLSAATGFYKGIWADKDVFINHTNTRFIQYMDDTDSLFEVDRSGRVGIGVTPALELDIKNDVTAATARIASGSHNLVLQSIAAGAVTIGAASNTAVYLMSNNTAQITFAPGALIFNMGLFGNFADDAAAATGGVGVGGTYRNGSALQVRVS